MWLRNFENQSYSFNTEKNTPAENVSISFEKISTTATVAIKEASTGAVVIQHLKTCWYLYPQLDTAPKFEIEPPSSTVTLAAQWRNSYL